MVLASVHEMVYDANNKRFDRKTRIAPEKLLMHWALEEKMKKNKMKMKKKKKRKKRNFLFLCVKESKSTLGIYKEEHIKKQIEKFKISNAEYGQLEFRENKIIYLKIEPNRPKKRRKARPIPIKCPTILNWTEQRKCQTHGRRDMQFVIQPVISEVNCSADRG